jgi:murein DD-endopeptidase MepM/ murein hydrolase activator NlpD
MILGFNVTIRVPKANYNPRHEGWWGRPMNQRPWVRRAIRILRHDLTLLCLVAAFVGVSAGVIAAARHDAAALAAYARLLNDQASPSWPPEEELATAEVPSWLREPMPPAVEPAHSVTEGRIEPGDSLARSLRRNGLTPGLANLIARELRPLFDFRRARPGHRYRVTLDAESELVAFSYRTSSVDGYLLRRKGEGWEALRDDVELLPREARVAGVITSNLHDAIVSLGGESQLARDFSRIFAWDVDFSRDVRPGDEFQILYERLYRTTETGELDYVRTGRILAARYVGSGKPLDAVYFESRPGRGGYYRPDGSSVVGQFLQAPLETFRISSSYSAARRHPILKVTRPHHGIDYAAPAGTPLWSVADGKVIYRGWAGGFGNLVKVRHSNGYVSYYAHLSRFAKGLKVGQWVQQKQTIGYVGQTGLATGPHVCFRVAKDGRYVDPARIPGPRGPDVPSDKRDIFHVLVDVRFAALAGGSPAPLVAVEEAS